MGKKTILLILGIAFILFGILRFLMPYMSSKAQGEIYSVKSYFSLDKEKDDYLYQIKYKFQTKNNKLISGKFIADGMYKSNKLPKIGDKCEVYYISFVPFINITNLQNYLLVSNIFAILAGSFLILIGLNISSKANN